MSRSAVAMPTAMDDDNDDEGHRGGGDDSPADAAATNTEHVEGVASGASSVGSIGVGRRTRREGYALLLPDNGDCLAFALVGFVGRK